ncbi:hypothetical protein [Pelomonas cellulosilytica]|uniref:Uncharacterized protein n=1 Tax=Pelomonas cellulosilytica TaxID=2906762 RepID=A0ABS8XWF6_9BURK|nr:hypothetical protein [Pelomonas sp. P8]MCE4556989.1 hypothetical protein [Pelomonas sp. P8]
MTLVTVPLFAAALAIVVAAPVMAQTATSASSTASAPVPATAASRIAPVRNAAVQAAENAKEPGVARPEERVIPQISVPLTRKDRTAPGHEGASAPVRSGPAVDDGAARCLAAETPAARAACQRGLAASGL